MKLLKRVVSIEAARERVRSDGAVGIIWSKPGGADSVVEGAAFDVHQVEGDTTGQVWRGEWRLKRRRDDLGDVYDAAGVILGRVLSVKGSLVELEYRTAGAAAPAPGGEAA